LVVEPTHPKNISQIGSSPQVGMKMKNIWNHHLVVGCLLVLWDVACGPKNRYLYELVDK